MVPGPQRHPLFQLPQVRLFEPLRQLRLSGEYDRKQFGLGSLDVGQQADLFEHLDTEALGLVNDKCRRDPRRAPFAQESFQLLE